MLNKLEKDILDAIRGHVPKFEWGTYSLIDTISLGHWMSIPWYKRFFLYKKMRTWDTLVHMALYYWIAGKKMDYPTIDSCEEWAKYDSYKLLGLFNKNVLYESVNIAKEGIFMDTFMWDIYVVLVRHGAIREEILTRYRTLRW